MKNIPKIAIIGAGNVGATTAMMIAEAELANIALFDVAKAMAKAKSIDMSHALAAKSLNVKVEPIDDYKGISGSSIVVVTAGFPRKPGMSRDDLLKANADIIKSVSKEIKQHVPGAIVIIVTNPLDVMAYLSYKTTGFNHNRILGMAGGLDSARLTDFIAVKLNAKRSDIKSTVLGSHGELMVPVYSQTSLNDKPLTEILQQKDLDELSVLTKNAGAQIVSLLGTGSAYYGPAASVFEMVKAMLTDNKTTHCACSYLQGEYGLRDVYIGVPCVLGKKGIERVVELKLTKAESDALAKSAESIKAMIRKLDLS